jgi:uncharacterized protein
VNTLLIAAFVTGLFGSLHCAGMCGPLALSFNLHSKGNPLVNGLIYNFSRITAYLFLGVIFGAIGFSFNYAGWQQVASILSGMVILIIVFIQQLGAAQGKLNIVSRYNTFIKNKIGNALRLSGFKGVVFLGFFNGLLPCGLVYLALAGALVSGDIISGGAYMLVFGLGTFPMMFVFAAFGNYLGFQKKLLIRKYLPVFSVMIAVLLILRGLNLGIPYVSPDLQNVNEVAATAGEIECHK